MKLDDIDIKHHFAGGVYAKETRIPAGVTLTQHVHKYDHLSILSSGTAVVMVDGVSTPYTGPRFLNIVAGKAHSVTAVTDVLWFCVHATEETDAGKVDAAIVEGR